MFRSKGFYLELEHLIQMLVRIEVLPHQTLRIEKDLLHSYAVELATEACNSNTAEKLAYTIQQLMFNEQDQKHEPMIGWRVQVENPKNTTFRDLEAWAVKASDGTVTVDAHKLQVARKYVQQYMYEDKYQWATMLSRLSYHYFSRDEQHRVDEVLSCTEESGFIILLYYRDSSRLNARAQLPSIWDYDKYDVVGQSFWLIQLHKVDCAAVIEDSTLIVEVAVASLTASYCEAVRQLLIARPLVLRWIATAILSKGILPATSLQMLGHIVLDYRPSKWDSSPALTTKLVPDYEDIPITVHNFKMSFVKYDKRFHG
eukprot:14034-Heterococcus_DN1.PRE.3